MVETWGTLVLTEGEKRMILQRKQEKDLKCMYVPFNNQKLKDKLVRAGYKQQWGRTMLYKPNRGKGRRKETDSILL